jgi:hypothetical protein
VETTTHAAVSSSPAPHADEAAEPTTKLSGRPAGSRQTKSAGHATPSRSQVPEAAALPKLLTSTAGLERSASPAIGSPTTSSGLPVLLEGLALLALALASGALLQLLTHAGAWRRP